ncbi:hypothetical protein EI555_015994, partial [Monodon monoceros]
AGDFVGRGTQRAEAVAEPMASLGGPCSPLVWLLLFSAGSGRPQRAASRTPRRTSQALEGAQGAPGNPRSPGAPGAPKLVEFSCYRCSVMMGNRSVYGEISGLVVPISRVIVHPQFSTRGTVKYDLALLRLFYPVNFTGVIQPICIPEKTFQVEAGTRCWVTGWGKQQEFSETVRQEVTLGRGRQPYPRSSPFVSVFLWEMDQYIIYYEECNGMIQKAMPADKEVVLEGVLCGYNSIGNDSCQLSSWVSGHLCVEGDSGDPLVCQYNTTWVQIGIVSWGVSCGPKISPGVYTDTAFYTKWLVAVVNQATSLYPVVLLILLVCLVLPLGILATLLTLALPLTSHFYSMPFPQFRLGSTDPAEIHMTESGSRKGTLEVSWPGDPGTCLIHTYTLAVLCLPGRSG